MRKAIQATVWIQPEGSQPTEVYLNEDAAKLLLAGPILAGLIAQPDLADDVLATDLIPLALDTAQTLIDEWDKLEGKA